MDFLSLCRSVATRCSVTGLIGSVVSQTGEFARVVEKVNEAWLNIQQLSDDWKFMRAKFEFTTAPNKWQYTQNEVTGSLVPVLKYMTGERDVVCYRPGSLASRTFLGEWDFASYESSFIYSATTPGSPTVFAIDDENGINLGAIPDAEFIVRGAYQRSATMMAVNADKPSMPDEYHLLVAHLASMKFAADDNLPEIYSAAKVDYDAMVARMRRAQLPTVEFCGPLA